VSISTWRPRGTVPGNACGRGNIGRCRPSIQTLHLVLASNSMIIQGRRRRGWCHKTGVGSGERSDGCAAIYERWWSREVGSIRITLPRMEYSGSGGDCPESGVAGNLSP
jgi:hypothetical protein